MPENNLSPASISAALKTHLIGQNIIYYPSLTSTNTMAKQEAQRGAVEGTVVIADEQTAGRGRKERVWLSPKGGIALSIIVRPNLSYLPSLVMVASLAVARCIEDIADLKPQIKWPNDVLINGKKVCGILIENDIRGERVDYAIIGIGINVNIRVVDFPEIRPIATSLSDELGREISRVKVVQNLLTHLDELYLSLKAGGSVYEEWRDNLATLGRNVTVKIGESTFEGIAEAVARDGSLLLRLSDGSLTKVVAGDVTLRH